MWNQVRGEFTRAKQQVRDDLDSDPYLVYILLLSFVLAGFWIWHRLPNFATRDERWRVVDPMEALGFVIAEPTLGAAREGILYWRSYGATFYLYGLTLLPVVLVAVLTGQLEAFTDAAHHQPRGYWEYWKGVPAWLWTMSVLLARLMNVMLAVGCVYVLYRIGTRVRDRAAGRLAAVLLSVTWGFLVLAHEAGEDIPALFFFLLAVYCIVGYLETGSAYQFYRACFTGGVAISFKPSAGVSAILIGIAYTLYARRIGMTWRDTIHWRGIFGRGLTIGAGVVVLGHPSMLVGSPKQFLGRFGLGFVRHLGPHGGIVAPSWWWIVRSYLHGVGVPLSIGFLGGIVAGLSRLRGQRRGVVDDVILIALAGTATYLLVYSSWSFVRVHHLLPTFPLLILVSVLVLREWSQQYPSLVCVVVAVLLVTSGSYAGVGVLGYATQPRDGAEAWLSSHGSANTTVETYVYDPQEAAVPHGMAVSQPLSRGRTTTDGEPREPSVLEWARAVSERCPEYIELNYQRGIRFLAPANYSAGTKYLSLFPVKVYFRNLMAEEKYPYRIVAEFGPRPPFLEPQNTSRPLPELARVGVVPRTTQPGDPQDFGVDQYTVLLERTERCP